jgi:hypothetical protein
MPSVSEGIAMSGAAHTILFILIAVVWLAYFVCALWLTGNHNGG